MQVAIPLYDQMTALDAIGPYEVLSRPPGWDVVFVAAEPGPKRMETDALSLVADASFDDVTQPDVICVPGGRGTRTTSSDGVPDWIATAHEHSRWTTSVCTGALLLGRAGVLDGLRATTHWMHLDRLREFGAEPVGHERVVREGKVMTAAGVSAGIDMALELIQLELGDEASQAVQLSIEYDPQPPFDAGSTEKAPEPIIELVRRAGERIEPPVQT
jgi:transcriptional regulator GlxA family with amidase domain